MLGLIVFSHLCLTAAYLWLKEWKESETRTDRAQQIRPLERHARRDLRKTLSWRKDEEIVAVKETEELLSENSGRKRNYSCLRSRCSLFP